MTTYHGIEFWRLNPPAKDEHIRQVEKLWNSSLPKDYRTFLKHHSGGILGSGRKIKVESYPVDNLIPMDVWYSVSSDDTDDYVVTRLNQFNFSRRVPPYIMPIGANLYEQRICLALRKENYGQVYLWAPFEEWIDELDLAPTEEDLYFMAASFEELLCLYEKAEECE